MIQWIYSLGFRKTKPANVPVAQLVEHSPEEPGVGGSIPSGYTITHTALETRWSIGLGSGLQLHVDGFDSRTCLPSSMKIVATNGKIVVDIRFTMV